MKREIKRAIISVYDKKGITEFARGLKKSGIEILATNGTCKLLQSKNISAKSISDWTHYPEMLDGRVKTLHPKIHAGLLALSSKEHQEELKKNKVLPLDMVVVNLYPFAEAARQKKELSEILENIDIGGISLLRSGAKNFGRVAAVSSLEQYGQILEELKNNAGYLSEKTLSNLAIEAFRVTSKYDNIISNFLESYFRPLPKDTLPENLSLQLKKIKDLRYGENPHQKAGVYALHASRYTPHAKGIEQLNGKELSYNNFADVDLVYKIVSQFEQPAVAIVKHQTPCGAAVNEKLSVAFQNALACDKISAFGGIVGFNKEVDEETAQNLIRVGFLECVIASDYAKKSLDILTQKKNLRILKMKFGAVKSGLEFKKTVAGMLIQEEDDKIEDTGLWKTASKIPPTFLQKQALLFAWKIVKYAKSNAIVIAKRTSQGFSTIGISGGQTSRVGAVDIALEEAAEQAKTSVLASDGFFPFADSVELAAKRGIKAIVQPGGSIRDKEIVAAADEAKIAMLFSGVRHFRH